MSKQGNWAAQLRNADRRVRLAAAEQLCQLGREARDAAVALVQATSDEPAVSQCAVAALEELGVPNREDLPHLVALARSPQELEAYWAVTLLGRLESAAQEAESTLVTVLGRAPQRSVRQRAAWALGRLGALGDAARVGLAAACHGDDPRLAQLAQQALQRSD
jgi:HEAT repeat protein